MRAVVPEVKVPIPERYELDDLYFAGDAKKMTGVSLGNVELGVGETVIIYVRGASNGKWFELPADVVVSWEADRELEVSPTTGHVVTVKVVKPIENFSFVTATTINKDGKKIEAQLMVEGKR